jgi:hypothetical protein
MVEMWVLLCHGAYQSGFYTHYSIVIVGFYRAGAAAQRADQQLCQLGVSVGDICVCVWGGVNTHVIERGDVIHMS